MASGKVTFNIDRCKGCALCTAACPKQIIAMDHTVINVKGYHPASIAEMEKCIACGMCAITCPDSVITVERI